MSNIETLNRFGVADGGRGFTLLLAPRRGETFTADDALMLAAYLVLMAERSASHTFAEVLEAVQNA